MSNITPHLLQKNHEIASCPNITPYCPIIVAITLNLAIAIPITIPAIGITISITIPIAITILLEH